MSFSFGQANAFQNNAFQISGSITPPGPDVILLGGTPAGPDVNPNAPGFFYDHPYDAYQREQGAVREKQEIVIALKLETQANLLRLKDLEKERDKQSKRQLKALEREQTRLEVELHSALQELAKRQLIARNNEALLVLVMARPFLTIGGQQMH